jgi:predicted transcriptional regulator
MQFIVVILKKSREVKTTTGSAVEERLLVKEWVKVQKSHDPHDRG